jgi:hypothetical protein
MAVTHDELEESFASLRVLTTRLAALDADTREDVRASVRARVLWKVDAPDPPVGHVKLVEELVAVLGDTRLAPAQAAELEREFARDDD